jgi:hypothetical protein
MWNEIALEELDENTNKSTKFCFNKITKWKYEQKYHILVESLAGLGFGERICHMMLTEKYPILSYAKAKKKNMWVSGFPTLPSFWTSKSRP